MNTNLNTKYKINPNWILRLTYYPFFGTYIEGYSAIIDCWVVVKRISYINVTQQ